jgi:hypothetical protein
VLYRGLVRASLIVLVFVFSISGFLASAVSVAGAADARAHTSAWRRARLDEAFPARVREELWLADYDAIDQATRRGWLVEVPHDPAGLGVIPRRTGRSPVGQLERDPALRQRLFRLARPAAGLLYQIVEYLRLREGRDFKPLELTSLVRPWTYQRRLMRSNANANTIRAGVPPTHVFGLAFDIPRMEMPRQRQQLLESYLRELEAAGKVIYFKEGKQATYHVVALPAGWRELERDYEQTLLVAAERRGASEATAELVQGIRIQRDN